MRISQKRFDDHMQPTFSLKEINEVQSNAQETSQGAKDGTFDKIKESQAQIKMSSNMRMGDDAGGETQRDEATPRSSECIAALHRQF